MPKKAKGKRPVYLQSPENDKLLAIVMALVGEVSVLRDRLDTIERLLQTKDLISFQEMENYAPSERVMQEREKWRAEYLARVLRILEEDSERE